MRASLTLLTLSLLTACAGNQQDARFATGSSTLVASSDYSRMFVVNTDAGTISQTESGSSSMAEIDVGVEPTRIARSANRLYVTLRGERAVAVLEETESGAQLVEHIDVGAEPVGVVASGDGTRVYVAVSQGSKVVEIETVSNAITRSWYVPGEPSFVALHPNKDTLFVATGRGAGRLFSIDVDANAPATGADEAPNEIALPIVERLNEAFEFVQITGRVTGDMSVSSDGEDLVIPVTYVDNLTPVGEVEVDGNGTPVQPADNGYGGGSIPDSMSRFNPGVVVVPVASGEADEANAEAIFISGFSQSDSRFRAGDDVAFGAIRSYPSSATVTPDGTAYVVTFQGSGAVALVGALPFEEQPDDDMDMMFDMAFPETEGSLPFTSTTQGGFQSRPKAFIDMVAHDPSGVAFLKKDSAWVHALNSRVVADLDYRNVFSEDLRRNALDGFDQTSFREVQSISRELAPQVLPEEVFEGRKLFFSSIDPGMVAAGAGVSCASCHFEGRNDGLTWTFDSGDRQTPSLAGKVSLTEPVTWTSGVESVAHEARITTEARMGGNGMAVNDLDKIAAYVDWSRVVDAPRRGASEDDAVARGQVLFEREDVGCASCHDGEAYTDNQSYTMFGLTNVNTPTLKGIAGSSPYLHDGRAATLRDVVLWSQTGEMGDTSMLSSTEIDDLTAYLESL